MQKDCIFCKIHAREVPSQIIAENEHVFVIKDRCPQAPIHYLIIPKKHICDISSLTPQDSGIASSLLFMAQHLALTDPQCRQFKLQNNNGPQAGQVVFHIHFHLN